MEATGFGREADPLTWDVIGAAMEVHRRTGPGLRERTYLDFLVLEVLARGLEVETEVRLPITYRGELTRHVIRLDLLVEQELIVELKATPSVDPAHLAQLLTYLRCAQERKGLLINFGVPTLKDGVRRVINPRARN